jgi:peptidoglycan hydrolase-like protein with peptidoglycan-binding domain
MNGGPQLSLGATGSNVERLQRLFVEMKALDYLGIDGTFGPVTHACVTSFQQSAGLVVDGIVGPATWGALPADPGTTLLSVGGSGPGVSALQRALATYSSEDPRPTRVRSTGSSVPEPRRPFGPTRATAAWASTASWAIGPGGFPPGRPAPRWRPWPG